MRRILIAAVILITAACAPSETADTATVATAAAEVEPSATPVPTTAAAVLPVPSPTAVVVPAPPPTVVAPTAIPQAAAPVATAEPTQVPAAAADPAQQPVQPTTAPTPSQSAEIMVANGAEVYTIACARCHGADGTGSDRYGGLLGVGNRYSRDAMIEELTNGHPITFGFAGQLSADEIASVVAYVKATYP